MDEHFWSKKLHNQGCPWLSNLITQLWDLQLLLWIHRNDIEHSDLTPEKRLQLEVLRTQATEELEAGFLSILHLDHHLFEEEDRIANLNLVELKQWLTEVRLAREDANHEFIQRQRSLTRAHAFMRDWLTTRSAPA